MTGSRGSSCWASVPLLLLFAPVDCTAAAAAAAAKAAAVGISGSSPKPIPAGWHTIPHAICDPHLPRSAGKACVPSPTFPDQCIWPYLKAGYAPGAYAATECAASPGCAAATCDTRALGAGEGAGLCAGRMQYKATCNVDHYISIIHGAAPPPPPKFRLAHSYSCALPHSAHSIDR
jgi:hypothetical protein